MSIVIPDWEDEESISVEPGATATVPIDEVAKVEAIIAKSSKTERLASANRDIYLSSTKLPPLEALRKGEVVAWTKYFLVQLGEPPTGEMWEERGVVVDPDVVFGGSRGYAIIHWRGEDSPRVTSKDHIARVGPNMRFCE